MRSKGYKCYNYHCGGRVGDSPLCGETGDTALSCQDRVVSTKTNADCIRAMSDEELAQFLCDFKDCAGDCIVGHGVKDCNGLCATKNTLLIWLQQPAKEE